MDIDIEFLRKSVNARLDVGKWLAERPYTGLDVTDVELLANGFDYLADIIKQLTGQDLLGSQTQIEVHQPEITITYGE